MKNVFGSPDSSISIGSSNFTYYYENTCSWQLTSYQTVLKSQIKLKITFSNSSLLKMLNKLDKSRSLIISAYFGSR